jgi:putative ABC transport system permease protein
MRFERWLYTVRLRVRSLFRSGQVERELDEELQFHLERRIEEYVASGLSAADARHAALRALGGVEQRKEECRDTRRVRLIQDAGSDLSYALRILRRSPAFTTAAVGTLALGIGATVAMFTVVNGVLLRPLPFPEPDRLVLVTHTPRGPFITQPGLLDRDYLAFRQHAQAFEHLAAASSYTTKLTGAGDPSIVTTARVTTDFFATLGVLPAAGRTFAAGDDAPGQDDLVVLSDSLWRGRLGADPSMVGRAITLDGRRRTVVGVMPAGFSFPRDREAWVPQLIRIDPGLTMMTLVLGRLKPGVRLAEATAEFETLARQFQHQPDDDGTPWIRGVLPLKELIVGDIRRPLEIFAGAVAFVLLVACANVANLLLARASGRRREIAVRAALGASRSRVIRQLLTESALVSLAGGACAIVLALWGVPTLLALAPNGRIPRMELIQIDGRVLAFALAVSLATSVVFGLAPAFRVTRDRWRDSLLPGGRTSMAGHDRLRSTLVVAEIALALVLLTGAGLLLKSFLRLRGVDPGFRPDNVVTLTVDLSGSAHSTWQQLQAFHTATLARLSVLPGALAAGAVNWRPLGDMLIRGDFQIEGGPTVPEEFNPDKPAVSAGYFSAMGIRLVSGRDFTEQDTTSSAGVAIVSRTVARMFPAENALGRRITLQTRPKPEDWLTVVGVVDDVKQLGPTEPSHAAIYQSYLQVRRPFFLSQMTFAVRTASDPLHLAPAIRTVLREVDRNQPAQSIASMADVLSAATAEPRFQSRLLGIFAMLALMLALVGTYGVLAYSVAQRTHEIGVRMALGARRSTVLWMVIRRTLMLGAAGVAIGTVGALWATRVLATFLFDVTPTDPATFFAVAVLILCSALVAGLAPARRATRIDPLVALRHE